MSGNRPLPLCAIPHARSAALGGLLTARPSLEAAYKVRSIGRHLSLLKEEEKVLRLIKDEERLRAATSDPSLLRTPMYQLSECVAGRGKRTSRDTQLRLAQRAHDREQRWVSMKVTLLGRSTEMPTGQSMSTGPTDCLD
jgi:hypothetical protein